MKRKKCQETCREELFYYVTLGSNVTRDVHWCVTVDYQQIENDNIANQIHGFTIDNGKFILIPVISLHISKIVFKFTRSNRKRALELLAGTYSCLHALINFLNKIMFWSFILFLAFLGKWIIQWYSKTFLQISKKRENLAILYTTSIPATAH